MIETSFLPDEKYKIIANESILQSLEDARTDSKKIAYISPRVSVYHTDRDRNKATKIVKFQENNEFEEDEFDIDARLIPPPVQGRRIKVKLKFRGKFPPKIRF